MPDRYLRGAILDSERFNMLTSDAQNFYYRLISVVDDFGCYDGRAPVIASAAYRYGRTDALPIIDLQRGELLVRYLNAGKQYIALLQWGEIKRNMRKFPAPPVNNDRPDIKYIGIWGRAVNWRNPPRTDLVSTMLDINGRAVQPQPPEWRRIDSDFAPLDSALVISSPEVSSPGVSGPTRHRSNATKQRSTGPDVPGPETSINVSTYQPVIESSPTSTAKQSPGPETPGPETPRPPTAATANGKIRCNKGAWRGLSEAQRLRWQEMFTAISIPDQLDRAAAWLEAHPNEHQEIARSDGEHAFIVRWLLREVRPATVSTRAKTDA